MAAGALQAETCPGCGIRYKDLRTGKHWHDVRSCFWSPAPDPETWCHFTRRTVLGRWHEIKRSLWEQHIEGCPF